MGLKDQRGYVLLALGGGLCDDNIAGFIRFAGKSVVFGELLEILGDGAFVARFAGNAGDFLEILENSCGVHNYKLI